MSDLTGELLAAVVAATPERKEAALKVLRGEVTETAVRPVTGPLLLGMGAAAKLLGVSRATLWRILQAGTIKKVELFHGSFRVRREDLEDLSAGKFGVVTARGQTSTTATNKRLQKMLAGGARKRNPRFQELVALADGGDEGAVGDLFKEFGFEHGVST